MANIPNANKGHNASAKMKYDILYPSATYTNVILSVVSFFPVLGNKNLTIQILEVCASMNASYLAYSCIETSYSMADFISLPSLQGEHGNIVFDWWVSCSGV